MLGLTKQKGMKEVGFFRIVDSFSFWFLVLRAQALSSVAVLLIIHYYFFFFLKKFEGSKVTERRWHRPTLKL